MTEEINYKELTEKLEEDIKLKDKLINKLTNYYLSCRTGNWLPDKLG